MMKMIALAFEDVGVYRERYASVQELSKSALQVLECFKEFPEKRLQVKDIALETGLPTRTVSHAVQILLKNKLIQKQGQSSSTRYQVIF